MIFEVVLEPGEDGKIIAHCPVLPGCWSQGETEDEAEANIREAIELWLETEITKRAKSRRRRVRRRRGARLIEVAV